MLLNVSAFYIRYYIAQYPIYVLHMENRRERAREILNSATWCHFNATDTNLTQCLTKINRMDIVHLMETSGIDSMQVHGTRTYAEMEQTIGLDHSEGKRLLTQTAQVISSKH